jgi:hypothetical protein
VKGDHYIKSLKKRQGLLIVIIAALTLEVLSGVQYYYTHRLMEQELEKRAELDLTMKALLKDFRAQLRGVIDKKFFIFRLVKIFG